MRRNRRVIRILFLAVLATALGATRGPLAGMLSLRPIPDAANVRYGPHERNVLDFWRPPGRARRPTPVLVFIHGGGFLKGSKSNIPGGLLRRSLAAGMAVASISYRLSSDAPFPAPMLDGARAVQFLRTKADDWNLDPDRIAAAGDSAGGGIALWVAYHDDLANPDAPGPIGRQSSRVAAVAGIGAQSTYDLRVIRERIGGRAAEHPALLPFYGLTPDSAGSPIAHTLFAMASPVNLVDRGDPPTFLYYSEPKTPLPPDARPGEGIHHPRFGEILQESLASDEIPCVLRHETDYRATDEPTEAMYDDMVAFFVRTLRPRRGD